MKKILVAFTVIALGLFVFVGTPTLKANVAKDVQTSMIDNASADHSDVFTPDFDGDKNKKNKKKSSSCKPSSCKPSGASCAPAAGSAGGDKKSCNSGTTTTQTSNSAAPKSCCSQKK
jgi:hypothetical protein